jgi:hypothetical protein
MGNWARQIELVTLNTIILSVVLQPRTSHLILNLTNTIHHYFTALYLERTLVIRTALWMGDPTADFFELHVNPGLMCSFRIIWTWTRFFSNFRQIANHFGRTHNVNLKFTKMNQKISVHVYPVGIGNTWISTDIAQKSPRILHLLVWLRETQRPSVLLPLCFAMQSSPPTREVELSCKSPVLRKAGLYWGVGGQVQI